MTRELTWCQQIQLSGAGAGGAEVLGTQFSFRMNSLNQPIITGGGTHKPYGYDQMAALYDRYIVDATDVQFMVQAPSGVLTAALVWSTAPSSSAFSITGRAVSDVIESTTGSFLFLDSTGITTIKRFALTNHVIEGLTKAQYLDELDDYSGASASGNPSLTPYLNVALANTQNTSALTLGVFVQFRFKSRWYKRTLQVPS
jgi:hypothetical protein